MQFISKFNRGFAITKAFHKILNEPKCEPNRIWADKSSKFHNISMKPFFQNNDIEIYSTHNEGKSVFPERFIRTLKKIINTFLQSQKICILIN